MTEININLDCTLKESVELIGYNKAKRMNIIWVHPENHKHDGHTARIKNLLLAAEKGELVVLFEGNEFIDPCVYSKVTVHSHGLCWSGNPGFVNGLEQITGTVRFHWAGILRFATGCEFKQSATLQQSGDCGIQIVRQLCILLSKMSNVINPASSLCEKIKVILGTDLVEFATTLSHSLATVETYDNLEVCGSVSCKLADELAIQRGKWPGKNIKFKDVVCVCYLLAPHVPGLEAQELCSLCSIGSNNLNHQLSSREKELLQEAVDGVIIYEREEAFAKSINAMKEFQTKKGDGTYLPIHIITGASHAYGIINDDYIHRIGLELDGFISQQKRVVHMASKDPTKKRLWELIKCQLFSHDPFDG